MDKKLAVLVLAHRDVNQLNRLIHALDNPSVDVYVHVDTKQGEVYRSSISGRAVLLPRDESYNISWGGIEMVLATVLLLKTAIAVKAYDHFALVSGQDYPVRSLTELLSFLDGGVDYISVLDDNVRFSSRYLLYYPRCLWGKQGWKRPIRFVYKGLGIGPLASFLQRKKRPAHKLYYGPSWWVLRRPVVEWMLYEIDRNPLWLRYYANSLNPDEGLFQTLYMGSPFAGQSEAILTYVDWSKHGPSPEVLKEEDFDAIRNSGKFFARKMDSCLSADLLNRLDVAIKATEAGEPLA